MREEIRRSHHHRRGPRGREIVHTERSEFTRRTSPGAAILAFIFGLLLIAAAIGFVTYGYYYDQKSLELGTCNTAYHTKVLEFEGVSQAFTAAQSALRTCQSDLRACQLR